MKKIPVSNQFDKWVKYNGEEMEDLVLYTVEVYKANLFFDKRMCLSYGKLLKMFRMMLSPLNITGSLPLCIIVITKR